MAPSFGCPPAYLGALHSRGFYVGVLHFESSSEAEPKIIGENIQSHAGVSSSTAFRQLGAQLCKVLGSGLRVG